MKISFAVALLIQSTSAVHSDQTVKAKTMMNIQNLQQQSVINARMEAWDLIQHNVNDKEYMASQESALNEQVIGQNLHMQDSGSQAVPVNKEAKFEQVADILSGKASIDDQDGSIKKLFGIKEHKMDQEEFVEKNQRLIPHEGPDHELTNEEQGLDDTHKSHMLLMSAAANTNPLTGEIPTNSENANTIANIMASPHANGTQQDLIKQQHDNHTDCPGCTVDAHVPIPQVDIHAVESIPEPVAADADPATDADVAIKSAKIITPYQSLAESIESNANQQEQAERSSTQFQVIKHQQSERVVGEVDSMTAEMNKFSQTLDINHYNSAISMAQTLKKEGLKDHDKLLSVHTKDAFKEGFKMFPQIAQNEFVQDQLQYLEGAEDNMNNNLTNPRLVQKYIDTGKEVAATLEKQFGEQWENPLKN